MGSLFDILSGLERGIGEADANVGKYNEAVAKREAEGIEKLIKIAKLQEMQGKVANEESEKLRLEGLVDEFYNLYAQGDGGLAGKAKEKLGELGLVSSKTHNARKEANLLREEIISKIISEKGLPKNKQVYQALRKEITPSTHDQIPTLKRGLLNLLNIDSTPREMSEMNIHKDVSPEEIIDSASSPQENSKPITSEEESAPSIWERLKKWGGNLKDEVYEQPLISLKDSLYSIPKSAARFGKGLVNLEMMISDAILGKHNPTPKLREQFNNLSDSLEKKYNETFSINPDSSASQLGDITGSLIVPGAKFGNPLVSGAVNALGFSALTKAAEGEELEDIAKGAPKDIGIGLALSALPAALARKANKNTDLLLKGATRSPKDALRLQKRVGEKGGKLSLGHALNEQASQDRFEKSRLPFSGTKGDLRKTKAAINEISKDLEGKYPNEPRKLGEAIQKGMRKAQRRASNLYEDAAGIEGVQDLVLSPKQLDKVIRGSTNLKGGPSVTQTPEVYKLTAKEGDKVNRLIKDRFSKVKRTLEHSWNNGNPNEEYFRIYRQLGLPNYLDVQDYYHSLNKFASKQGIFNYQADPKMKAKWNERIDPIKSIINDMDKSGKFKQANTFYKKEVLPYKKEKAIWKSAEVLNDSDAVAPIFDFFSKEGNVNSEKIFNQLSEEDKRRVIGMMLHKNRAIDTPLIRSTYREEKNLPSYITNSKDPYVKNLVEELEDAARLNTNMTQIQGSLKTKGSGQETNRLANSFLASLIGTGGVNAAKTVGTLGTGGVYQRLRRLYETNPKTLEKYLNPETLKRIRRMRASRVSEALIKARSQEKKEDGSKTRNRS